MEIKQEKSFKKDWKRCKKRGCSKENLAEIIKKIESHNIERKHKPHKWIGNFRGHSDVWELHIKGDWLLLYKIEGNTLILLGTGTHSDFVN